MSLNSISAFSILVPTLIGLILIRKQSGALIWLSALVFATALLEAVATVLVYEDVNNMFVFHLYTYVEFTLIAFVFLKIIESTSIKNLFKLGMILFFLFSILNSLFWESIMGLNSNQRYVEGILLIVFCVIYFAQLLKKAEFIKLETYPYFWLVGGFLIYFSGTLILFLVDKHLDEESLGFYWNLHAILNIFLNCCYAIALWLGRKTLTT